MQHRYLSLPHIDYLRAHGTWEHTDLRAVRPKTEQSHKRKCQHIRSLGKQADRPKTDWIPPCTNNVRKCYRTFVIPVSL